MDSILKLNECFRLWICMLFVIPSYGMSDEKRLIKHLLQNYEDVGITGRPVFGSNQTIDVWVGLGLINIAIFERNQEMGANVWMKYSWTDMLLRWNPDDFGGLSSLNVPFAQIWTPDIMLMNAVSPLPSTRNYDRYLATVSNIGEVILIQHEYLQVFCGLDTTYYPYDQQVCQLDFSSWTFDVNRLRLKIWDDSAKIYHDERYTWYHNWDIVDNSTEKYEMYRTHSSKPFDHITYKLKLRRRAGSGFWMYILPTALLSALTPAVFLFPPASEFRKLYGVLVFISLSMILAAFTSALPESTLSTPRFVLYVALLLIMNVVAILLSFIVGFVKSLGETRVSMTPFIKRMLVGPIVRIIYGITQTPIQGKAVGYSGLEGDDVNLVSRENSEDKGGQTGAAIELENLFRDLMDILVESRDKSANILHWKVVANILDVLFMCVYTAIICVSAGLFLTSPFE